MTALGECLISRCAFGVHHKEAIKRNKIKTKTKELVLLHKVRGLVLSALILFFSPLSPSFFSLQSSLIAHCQECIPNQDAPHLSCLLTTDPAQHGAKSILGHCSAGQRANIHAGALHRQQKEHCTQGKDFLASLQAKAPYIRNMHKKLSPKN